MRTWLRLTSLFGPPDDKAESGNIISASIGLILRADADDLVHAPMPRQFAKLLRQIAEAEREAESCFGATVSDSISLIADPAPCADHGSSLAGTQRIGRVVIAGTSLEQSEGR
jgi:hypothetical protein